MLLDALAFLFPVPCAGCGQEGRMLCRPCRAALEHRPHVAVLPGIGRVHAGLGYDGVARSALLAFKEHGASGLASALAGPFARAVSAAVDAGAPDLLAAVPSTRAARRRRGFAPVELLAGRAGIRLSPVFAPARPHATQKSLDVARRAANLAGAIGLARSVRGRRVLLLDDVATTGATLSAAATAVRSGGGEVVGAAVLAAVERRDGRSAGTPGIRS